MTNSERERDATVRRIDRMRNIVKVIVSDDRSFSQLVAFDATAAMGERGIEKDELVRIMTWYTHELTALRLLALVITGKLTVHFPEGADEPEFRSRDGGKYELN